MSCGFAVGAAFGSPGASLPACGGGTGGFLRTRAKELLTLDPDSALVHALVAEEQLSELRTSDEKARALLLIGDAQLGVRDLPAALSVYQRAQRLVEEALEKEGVSPPLLLSRSDVQAKIGLLHFYLRDYDKSIAGYNEAMRILDQAQDLDTAELAMRKVRLFNNIAGVYIQRADYATALPYYQQAVEINRSLNDLRNESSLNNNIGICLMETGQHALANEYFLKSLAVRKENGDARGQAQVLNNLGKNQVFFGRFDAARDHFERALAIGRGDRKPRVDGDLLGVAFLGVRYPAQLRGCPGSASGIQDP
ncbi:MAG: tetratricopeptide repeat protein [Flavobacteriales bacterium]|nr:tetratricopeptide repeat protein [Flavobacteriales bacterium]